MAVREIESEDEDDDDMSSSDEEDEELRARRARDREIQRAKAQKIHKPTGIIDLLHLSQHHCTVSKVWCCAAVQRKIECTARRMRPQVSVVEVRT